MKAKSIMLQGTSSHVGKSVLAAGLCRLLFQDGFKVAPFKSQNMALNSYVTADGSEIGRAQGVQAEASGIPPTVEMNPILLKPKEEMTAQVIVMGKPLSDMSAVEYRNQYVPRALNIVEKALQKLQSNYQVVVIEGAGSPAEINLKDRDIANMKVAELAGAPVFLVADIERGGAFASLIGTLELLTPEERERIAGFIINKFRGDASLLQPALDFLEERTGLPVLGVVPHVSELGIEEEDSVALAGKNRAVASNEQLDVAVLRLPRISNFNDFDPLQAEKDVSLRYVESKSELGSPDAVIIPGTKNTVGDLLFLQASGIAEALQALRSRVPVVGVCGGFQMMGEHLYDPDGIESSGTKNLQGLGLLPMNTFFEREKITRQVKAKVSGHDEWGDLAGLELQGYEIRHGRSDALRDEPSIGTEKSNGNRMIGLRCGEHFGTYLHDLFYNDYFRRQWLNTLRAKKNLPPLSREEAVVDTQQQREHNYNRLAQVLREHLDLEQIYRIIGIR